ncbi:hypothetical protein SCHIN_v1c07560 [Spiroplasma chinense]|uniref:KAP NTPase domain-containing protein n=1 Tax=Spiroplasma chinense TaxID=216932 RepID=A0A5B9Y4I3_9MOLU|nr:P-loop NTPase fold protein [Spiroplasma chinense]QEH61951.1 hypothetical protein SCHIN_v1c07560 [Spiroplasma chinense]
MTKTDWLLKIIQDYFAKKNNTNSIAIHGDWGTGKSSYMDLLKKEIAHYVEDTLTYKIDLWSLELHEDNFLYMVIVEFFKCLSINPSNDKLIKSIPKFLLSTISNITKIDFNKFTEKNDDKIIENLNSKNDLENNFKTISKTIDSGNNNYVFIFDELDRCSKENQIKFFSILYNILFKLKNTKIFFLVSANFKKVSKIDYDKTYTEKFFDINISIEKLVDFDNTFINGDKLITDFIKHVYSDINDFRFFEKTLNLIKSFILEDDLDKIFFLHLRILKYKNREVFNEICNSLKVKFLSNLSYICSKIKFGYFDGYWEGYSTFIEEENKINAKEILKFPLGNEITFDLKAFETYKIPLKIALPFINKKNDNSIKTKDYLEVEITSSGDKKEFINNIHVNNHLLNIDNLSAKFLNYLPLKFNYEDIDSYNNMETIISYVDLID